MSYRTGNLRTGSTSDTSVDRAGDRRADAVRPDVAEWVERLAGAGAVRVERIISRGHRSPDGFWYDQDENEWVVVIAGRARLGVENGGAVESGAPVGGCDTVEMKPGDWIDLPAHTRHRVEWTDPDAETIWLAVHYGPR